MSRASQNTIPDDALRAVGVPDTFDTPFGTFRFEDGRPDPDTISRTWDALDLMRGVEVFLNTMPGASLVAMRHWSRSVGVDASHQMAVYTRCDSEAILLTANTETTYGFAFLDLRADGPTVVDCPPGNVSVVDDFWFRYVTDIGFAGPDRGQGGKFLFLPPGYDGDVPDGYFSFRCPTFTNWLIMRNLEGLDALKQTRIYPLRDANHPPDTEFVVVDGVASCGVHANDFTFYEEVNEIVQEEPATALDAERAGHLASIGIVKGQRFSPDDRMRRILSQAAPLGAAIARALAYKPRDPGSYIYGADVSSWKTGFVGGSYEFLSDGARLLDARTLFHYMATVITPAMAAKMVGVGSQYAYTAEDSTGAWLDGARAYRLQLPKDVPAKDFWSVCVYDCQTRSLLRTDDPYPSVNSKSGGVEPNPDGSVDVYFGPTAPAGKERNWIQTVPDKGWFTILRLYGPLESWFDHTWRPGEIERI